jgi:DNA-binding IclR family transcriptional regulator
VLSILQAFSSSTPTRTAKDLAKVTSIPLPSVYRYIALLRETGLLIGDDRGAYWLSPRLISLARAAEAAESLIGMADPVMRDLVRECGETAMFVRLIARVPVCVHRVDTAHGLFATFEPGQSMPLYRGATGRVLLAGLPERARQEHLMPLAETDPEAAARVTEAVAQVAACGWSTCEEEIDRGVWSASAAVTNGQSAVGALTVPFALVRAPTEHKERLVDKVRSAAARLSQRIADAQRS